MTAPAAVALATFALAVVVLLVSAGGLAPAGEGPRNLWAQSVAASTRNPSAVHSGSSSGAPTGGVSVRERLSSRPHKVAPPPRAITVAGFTGVGRRVALTFDDGWVPRAWRSILNTLRHARAPATFFVPGGRVVENPSLARRTVAQGELIGSHSWSHHVMTSFGYARQRAEVLVDRRVWWRVARATPEPYFRPPHGVFDKTTLRAVAREGYTRVVLWNVAAPEAQYPGPAVIAASVLAQVRPGSIILLHLIDQTAAALPTILRGLSARHLEPVRLDMLFDLRGAHIIPARSF